jgi:hypothetical protein
MGSDRHYPEEAPVHRVSVGDFWIDRTLVTNRRFKEFIRAAGHKAPRTRWWFWMGAVLCVTILGHFLTTLSLHAQGGFSINPYCAQYNDGSSLDCSFSTLSQCYQSVSGVGGVCIDNPRAGTTAQAGSSRFSLTPQPPFGSPYAFAPAPAPPPPPISSQSPQQLTMPQPQQTAPAAPVVSAPPPPPPCNPLIDGTYCATANSNPITTGIQSLSSDLSGGGDPPATLGAINFSGSGGVQCIGLFRQTAC